MFSFFLVIQIMASMPQIGITSILPFIQHDLQLSIVQMGYLAAAAHLGIAVCSIPSGLLVDYFGVKRMLFIGGLFVGVASISLFWLGGYLFTLIAFLIIGVFYANIHPAISKGILILFSPRARGTAMGIKQTGVSELLLLLQFGSPLWQPIIIGRRVI